MKTIGSLSLAAGLLFATAIGCSSTTSGTGATTTTTTKTTSSSSGTGGTGTGGSATGGGTTTTTTTAAPTLDCTSYCTEVMTNCTGAALAQYADMNSCMGSCAGFTAPGTLADKSGDTLGCRIYHAGAAAGSAANATTHCPHGGPTGGDKDPKGTAGICGEPCTAFCAMAAKTCASAFATPADCATACAAFKADTAAYSTADTATNDMGCRFYHLTKAATDAASATTHCPHIVAASPVCTQ